MIMNITDKNKKNQLIDYNVDIKTITFAILSTVLTVILICFIRIYADKRHHIIVTLNTEASNLEKTFVTDINYSKYFLSLIAGDLQYNHHNIEYIKYIFTNYVNAPITNNLNNVFGWRKYSWINKNFEEIVTSDNVNNANKILVKQDYIQQFISTADNQINFYVKKSRGVNDSLKLIYNIFSKQHNHAYQGSVVLSYDMPTMIRRLKTAARDSQTHFVILDDKLKVVVQSEPIIKNIIKKNGKLSKYLNTALRRGDITRDVSKSIHYLDMLKGTNYNVKKIDGIPFIMITNLDNNGIRNTILDNLVKKFIEVGFFGMLLFLSIISIYKRETALRAKAEKATIMSNKATKAKSEFLAFTAHEIRSPLGFIVTGAEVMTKEFFGPIPELYKSYIQGIYQNSIIILDFIKDILDENKIIEGKFHITNSVLEIQEVIQEAIITNKARFSERKIEIYSQLDKNLPSVIGDDRRLLQVMNNLISNAIKYSKDNTRIVIRALLVTEGLKVEIEDQGVGMSKSEVKNILSGTNMTVKNYDNNIESYGLGLLIVKMLLEAHEAKLAIDSRENVGTTVKITLPKRKLIFAPPSAK
jgi:signal transduction histidine kinase